MDGLETAAGVTVCLISSAMAGVLAQARLPAGQLARGSIEILRRGVGIIAVMAGLLLVLLVIYLKTGFDNAGDAVQHFAAEATELDTALRQAGPAAAPARTLLFRYTARTMKDIWPDSTPTLGPNNTQSARLLSELEDSVLALHDDDPARQNAGQMAREAMQAMIQTRWTLAERANTQVSPWLIGILLFWLMLSFTTLGLWAPRTKLVLSGLFLCALGMGGAMFLVVEYAGPFDGLIIVSAAPLQTALFALSQ
jgi:hypothetical protein